MTVEEAAGQFDGLLSGDAGKQEPEEKEAAESTDSEASEGEDEGDAEPEAEESEAEESEEGEEAEPSYTVKLDGKDAKVPVSELLKGYQRQSDYTRKTQQLAEERRELDSIKAEREHYADALGKVKAMLDQAQPKEPDWDTLLQQNPAEEVFKAKVRWDLRQQQLQALEAEQAKVKAAQEADEAKATAEYVAKEQEKLLEAIPDWKDAKKASIEKAKLVEHGANYGYTPEELAQVTDSRAVRVLRDAMLYREMVAKQKAIKPNVQQPSIKPARGGAPQNTPAKNLARDMKRLVQSGGDTRVAAEAFMHFIE